MSVHSALKRSRREDVGSLDDGPGSLLGFNDKRLITGVSLVVEIVHYEDEQRRGGLVGALVLFDGVGSSNGEMMGRDGGHVS